MFVFWFAAQQKSLPHLCCMGEAFKGFKPLDSAKLLYEG